MLNKYILLITYKLFNRYLSLTGSKSLGTKKLEQLKNSAIFGFCLFLDQGDLRKGPDLLGKKHFSPFFYLFVHSVLNSL